jgi:hypothetical protein
VSEYESVAEPVTQARKSIVRKRGGFLQAPAKFRRYLWTPLAVVIIDRKSALVKELTAQFEDE